MPLPWLKLWVEALDDSKLTRLSLAERGAWWGLMALAGKCEADGKITSGGKGLDLDEIADSLHIKTPEDRQSLESMIDKMKERGSLVWNGKTLTVVNYVKRNRVPDSARPEAVAERQRQHREREKTGALPPTRSDDPDKYTKGPRGHMVHVKYPDKKEPTK